MFPFFYKSAGTCIIKFVLAIVEISGQNDVKHLYRF